MFVGKKPKINDKRDWVWPIIKEMIELLFRRVK